MAIITRELNIIYNYWKGEEIRFPIHDAISKINEQIEQQNAGIDTSIQFELYVDSNGAVYVDTNGQVYECRKASNND